MFETGEQRIELVNTKQKEVLTELNIPMSKFRQVFYSRNHLRLSDFGFNKFKNTKAFLQVEFDIEVFKIQDLVKISKLNNDLFYIDLKNNKVYTLDSYFSNWCKLCGGNISAVRDSA